MPHCQQLRRRRTIKRNEGKKREKEETRHFSTEKRPMFDYEIETVRSCCVTQRLPSSLRMGCKLMEPKQDFLFFFISPYGILSSSAYCVESGELFWFVLFWVIRLRARNEYCAHRIHTSLLFGNHADGSARQQQVLTSRHLLFSLVFFFHPSVQQRGGGFQSRACLAEENNFSR